MLKDAFCPSAISVYPRIAPTILLKLCAMPLANVRCLQAPRLHRRRLQARACRSRVSTERVRSGIKRHRQQAEFAGAGDAARARDRIKAEENAATVDPTTGDARPALQANRGEGILVAGWQTRNTRYVHDSVNRRVIFVR